MRFVDYCLREAALYGKRGSGTLECVSMTVSAGHPLEMKTYFEGLVDTTEIPETILAGMQRVIEKIPGLKVADTVVYRNNSKQEPEYAVNLLTTGVTSDIGLTLPKVLQESFELLSELSENLLPDYLAVCNRLRDVSVSRLNNLGLRFDNSGRVTGAKYYLNIKKELPVYNAFDEDISSIVGKIAGERKSRENALPGEPENSLLVIPEKYGYYPTLLGVNLQSGQEKTVKVYYDTGRRSGKHADVIERSSALLTELGLDEKLNSKDICALFESGIYLRGVGLVPGNPDTVRLYAAER